MSRSMKPFGVHDKLILILSEHSMGSDWVGTEISKDASEKCRRTNGCCSRLPSLRLTECKNGRCLMPTRERFGARDSRVLHSGLGGWESDHGKYQQALAKLV